jgi:predicted phage terminase large subunit-like protein
MIVAADIFDATVSRHQSEGCDVIKPQPGPQFNALASEADIIIYGGSVFSGKTYLLLMEPLRYILIPNFTAVCFRKTSPQIHNEGGLWDTSEEIYPKAGGIGSPHNASWRFPSGARIRFSHLQYDKDVHWWQGSQIPLIMFDELTHFSSKQFFYMLSRNRSATGIAGYMRATCNPDPDSWVATFVEWWINQDTGLPIPERSGVLRWFIRVNDRIIWCDTPGELRARYGSDQRPKSVTFIAGKLTDNKIGTEKDPAYLASLMALPMVDRERLLNGNWKIRATSGMCFKRHWFQTVEYQEVPVGGRTIRYSDRASTEPTPEYPDPDWTRCLKVRYVNGIFYIMHLASTRSRPLGVKTMLKNLAEQDGHGCDIVLEGDPASAGDFEIEEYIRFFAGWSVIVNKPTKNKYERAKPAMTQAEAGNIKLVRSPGGHAWHEEFLGELEAFAEDPKLYAHDDIVDILSGAVHVLTGQNDGVMPGQLRAGLQRPNHFAVDRLTASDLRLS